MNLALRFSLGLLLSVLLSCGGKGGGVATGGNGNPAPDPVPFTNPVVTSIEVDPRSPGQYLINYQPSSLGPYNRDERFYFAQYRIGSGPWTLADTSGWFTVPKDYKTQLPLNLLMFSEGTTLSIRVGVSNLYSNEIHLAVLPFAPSINPGFNLELGLIECELINYASIISEHFIEISSLDAYGDAISWKPLTIVHKGPSTSTTRSDYIRFLLLMPPEYENQEVAVRAKTVSSGLTSPYSGIVRRTLGLAIPTQFTATPDASGITLKWKTNTKSTTASLWIVREPGNSGLGWSTQPLPLAILEANATQWIDHPPMGGTYRYQLVLLDNGTSVAGPVCLATTSDASAFPSTAVFANGYGLVARLPNGNVLVGNTPDNSIIEVKPDGKVASTLTLPSDGIWNAFRSTTLDASGNPHLLYQTYDQGYQLRHAWKEADGWHVENLPRQADINPVSTPNNLPRLFCREPGEIWVVSIPERTLAGQALRLGLLRKSGGQWQGETNTAPGPFVPDTYGQCKVMTLDDMGTLSLVFPSNADQILLRRKLDGTFSEQLVPFAADPGAPGHSMPIEGLLTEPGGILHFLRLGYSSAHVQSFDGTTFGGSERVPIPAALGMPPLAALNLPSISTSANRMTWGLLQGQFAFICLRDGNDWKFNAVPASTHSFKLLYGFAGERFWHCRLEWDPLVHADLITVEIEP